METKEATPQSIILIGIIVLLIGVVLSVVAGVKIRNYNEKKRTYVKTVAEIVDYDINYDEDGYEMYAPIVEFEVNGTVYEAVHTTYTSHVPLLGTEMIIRYNKNNPNKVIFEYDSGNYGVLIVACIFDVVGLLLLSVGIKKAVKPDIV